jgi:hypothetical protein
LIKIRDIIGSWRFMQRILSISTFEEWIKFLLLWKNSLRLEKLSNAEVIIKKCKRSMGVSKK